MRDLPADAVHEAPVAGGRPITGRTHLRGLTVALLAGLLMAFVGAFGTGDLPFAPRLAYWLVIMGSGALIGFGASSGIRGWHGLAHRPLVEGLVVSILIALPLTLVTNGATAIFFGPRAFSVEGALSLFVAVFVVTAAITAVNNLTGRSAPPVVVAPAAVAMPVPDAPQPDAMPVPESEPPLPPPSARPRLIERLPHHLRGGEMIALEAEDHYVRVHVTGGSDLLLLRLTDAVAELDGLPGARTHRSWWVARDAVRTASRGDGRGELTLANGVVAPVSRSALASLQRDGWFAGPPAG